MNDPQHRPPDYSDQSNPGATPNTPSPGGQPPAGDPASSNPASAAQNPAPAGKDAAPSKKSDSVVTELEELPTLEEGSTHWEVLRTALLGKPRNLADRSVYKHISLAAFFAWVGLGADGLSSSCYGPSEAFHNLGAHTYLAVFLALATIVTVFVISACYSHIIEEFPSGGGGYLVASKLLGQHVGAAAGCALLVDYVLTITVSIAAAGEALSGLFGPHWAEWKITCEAAAIIVLVMLNLRGVKESVTVLMPIFVLFLLTHALLIVGAIGLNVDEVYDVARDASRQIQSGLNDPKLGLLGLLALFLHAYSLGAGTYTGIEAVSNSMADMREPRVDTGKRTMTYMAVSLSITAGGLIIGYLLLGLKVTPDSDETLNHLLTETLVAGLGLESHWFGQTFLYVTMLAEGALLIVAALAGFIGGPRLLSNMALDSWMPHPFANLSERLAAHNGVILLGVCALAALLYTHGDVTALVVMYSINVFVTFSLSMLGMLRLWWRRRGRHPLCRRRLMLFGFGALLCLSILGVTVYEKFHEGGWRTLSITGAFFLLCLLIRRYYRGVTGRLRQLSELADRMPAPGQPTMTEPDPKLPTAAILVGGYGGLGMHTFLNAMRFAPGYYRNVVFLSVGVVDSGSFKGAETLDDLRRHTEESLNKYAAMAKSWGMPAASFMMVGTDAVDELEQLCLAVARRFPKVTFFAGQLVFHKDTWYQRILHNQTAFALLRRLQWARVPVVILPTRVN